MEVTSCNYLGTTQDKDDTCSAEVCIWITSAMEAMATLKRIWRCNTIGFISKLKLCRSSPVTSILLYGCETWTLLAHSEKTVQAFETKCLRKLLRIFYLEHKTNDWVRRKIIFLLGQQEPLMVTINRGKLAWFDK